MCHKSIWSVYKVAGEAYGSKLIGNYCSPNVAYLTALRKQLYQKDTRMCFETWVNNKQCLRDELHALHHEVISSKNFLNTPIYHVKMVEYTTIPHVEKCATCVSCPPTCLR